MGGTKGTHAVLVELKDGLYEIKQSLKWKARKFDEMLKAIWPAEIKRFLKWKAKGLVELLDKAAKEENKDESTDELETTAYLASILVFVFVGILSNL